MKGTVVIGLLALLISGPALAQSTQGHANTAHLNWEVVVQESNAGKAILSAVNALKDQRLDEVRAKGQLIAALEQLSVAATLAPESALQLRQELAQEKVDLERAQVASLKDVQELQARLMIQFMHVQVQGVVIGVMRKY